jgi:hypothetical protein
MPNLQDVVASYQDMSDDDKIHFFHFLNVTKDPVIVEREKSLRDAWKRNLKAIPETITTTPEQIVPVTVPTTPAKEDNKMALDPEVKAMFDQMQNMFLQNFQSVASSVSDIQKQIAQQELKTYKEKLISDKKVPAHLVRYVSGNTVDELVSSAEAVLQSYAAIEEEMKQRYATAAAPAITPTVSEQPAQETPQATQTNNPPQPASNTPPLNPLAPPTPDPVLPNPPAGLGAGQQITAEEISQIDYERYSSDPQLRAKLEADLKSRLGNKPLFTASSN